MKIEHRAKTSTRRRPIGQRKRDTPWVPGNKIEAAGRDVMDALGRQDLPRLDELSDPEVEWHSLFAGLGAGGVYRGHEGTRRYISDVLESFEIVRADVDGGFGVGDVAVLVGRIHYRGRGSGVENESPTGWVLRFREGKLIYFRAFRDPAQAFERVGLEGEKLSQKTVDVLQRP